MFIVSVGNPFDGIQIFGPFSDVEEANEWAEVNAERFAQDGGTWHSTFLYPPAEHPDSSVEEYDKNGNQIK
jgi:hypothetical protein